MKMSDAVFDSIIGRFHNEIPYANQSTKPTHSSEG